MQRATFPERAMLLSVVQVACAEPLSQRQPAISCAAHFSKLGLSAKLAACPQKAQKAKQPAMILHIVRVPSTDTFKSRPQHP